MKREDVISWDTYFMALAHLSAQRSKDPHTQVGAVIVDDVHRIVSIGYNGMPRGCYDDEFPWGREGDFLDTKYAYVVHAELNAILNARTDVNNCTIYVSEFPCNECAKAIIQSGIKHLVFECDHYADKPSSIASKRMLRNAGVTIRKLDYTISLKLETGPAFVSPKEK